jgi:la-related protein 1
MNGNGFHESPVQLAGGAPNFTPGGFNSVQTSNGFPPVSNGTYTSHGTPVDERLQGETTFSDENVQNLTLVFDSPEGNRAAKSGAPFHNASSRTFSHGSIDGSSVAEEFNGRQGPGVINGTHANEA